MKNDSSEACAASEVPVAPALEPLRLRVALFRAWPSLVVVLMVGSGEPFGKLHAQGSQYSSSATLAAEFEEVQAAAGDLYGAAVALSEHYAVVGAPGDDGHASDSGAAYVFYRDTGGWILQQKLCPRAPRENGRFGASVVIDGDTMLVGAPGAFGSGSEVAAAYVYTCVGASWHEQQRLDHPLPTQADHFGAALALSGSQAFVSAPGAAGGRVFAFERNGEMWSCVATLQAGDTVVGDAFGVALDFDGESLVVGAQGANSTGGWSGAAYVFCSRAGSYQEAARLVPEDSTASLFFGSDVAVDGELIAVGARGDSSGELWSGASYIYVGGGATWVLEHKLKSDEVLPGAYFGSAVELESHSLLVGARWDPTLLTNSGAAYLYHRAGGAWVQEQQLLQAHVWFNDWFGAAVAMDRGEILIGGPLSNAPLEDSGSVAAWRRAPGSSFCFGDGDAAPCPCLNHGAPGGGCANALGGGALLQVDGTSSLSGGDLRWFVSHLGPQRPAMLLAGTQPLGDGLGSFFGDGLNCLGGQLWWLTARSADGGGHAQWRFEDLPQLPFSAGQTLHFQVWYRDVPGGQCGYDFNTSNGYVISFDP